MLVAILFWAFSAVLVGASLGVILSRNPVHSVLYLVLCFFNAAVLWILIEAEFLAIVLVLVYVGAVMVLFLFVVMMLDVNIEKLREGFARNAPLGVLIALIMVVELAYVLWVRRLGIAMPGAVAPSPASNTAEIGAVLYTQYAYPFQLAAIVLLIAIVAAITLTMRRRPGARVQDVAAQVAVRAKDRVRIVSMPAEREP